MLTEEGQPYTDRMYMTGGWLTEQEIEQVQARLEAEETWRLVSYLFHLLLKIIYYLMARCPWRRAKMLYSYGLHLNPSSSDKKVLLVDFGRHQPGIIKRLCIDLIVLSRDCLDLSSSVSF